MARTDPASHLSTPGQLRHRAEELLRAAPEQIARMNATDVASLVHELQVHQMELELQNEELRLAQAELADSRDRYADLYEFAPVGYVSVDEVGRIDDANLAACMLLGVERARLVGATLSRSLARDSQDAWYLHRRAVLAPGAGRQTCEVEAVRGDGRRMALRLDSCAFEVDGRTRCRTALVDVTETKRTEIELKDAHDQLETRVRERTAELRRRGDQLARMASDLILTEKRERNRLARVLHDHLQQLLVSAKYALDAAGHDGPAARRRELQRVDNLLAEAITASRSLTAELSPSILYEHGLAAGLEWLGRWMMTKSGLHVVLQVDQDCTIEREDVRLLLFESIREGLFNVVKHAGVRRAEVALERTSRSTVRAVVSDQGRGFDLNTLSAREAQADAGFGLFSIRERLGLLGGEMCVDSAPGTGTRLTMEVPLSGADAVKPVARTVPAGAGTPGDSSVDVARRGDARIRVMLADDHRMVREGLAALLATARDIVVVGEAADGQEAVEVARRLRPDVILMDYSMPEMNGVEATRLIHGELPAVRIIGLSTFDDASISAAMRQAGALAFMTKGGRAAELLAQIRAAVRS